MGAREPLTEWRQGRVFSAELVDQLSLELGENDDPIVIVVSHDCDLAAPNTIEPRCEVIPGRILEAVEGTFTNAKNPRKLHLVLTGGSLHIHAEFIASNKVGVNKHILRGHYPSERVRLTSAEFSILQRWLRARYDRASFPDEFDRRFKQGKLYRQFCEIIKGTSNHLLKVLFDVDAGREIDREGHDDTYSLRIYLLYNVTEDPGAAELAATKAAETITSLFRARYSPNGIWQDIELEGCEAISESVLTIFQDRMLKEWYFDYMSVNGEI